MLTAEEIRRSVAASWMLFRGKDEGMRGYDVSLDGFWRSFRVIVLMLPLYLIMLFGQRTAILAQPGVDAADFPDNTFLVFNLIGMCVDWVAYPIVVALIAKPIGIGSRFIPFIVARNWTSLLALVPYSLPMLLMWLGVISENMMSLMMLLALGIVLHYRFVMTRAALGTPTSVSIGFVVLDFVLSLVLSLSISRMIGFG